MKISKEQLLRINKGFGGGLRSDTSINFAVEKQEDRKIGIYKKLAYLWRAIIVYHPFIDGNKRTAIFMAFEFAEQYNKQVINRDLLLHHAVSIAKKGITSIRQIEWRLKNAIR